MTEQRRLAAILVADVVGYSKLIGSDEAATLALLKALRTEIIEPQIAKYAGRLFKSVGDGFLIEFASAVQAVSCAKAIQVANGQGSLPLRIGIHVGDVVVQGDDLMGDGVNVAARVEGTAEPGGIAITRAVHEQVRDKLDLGFVDKGEIELKNIQRPMQVFVIRGAKVDAAQATALPLPDKPSIAVLPFQNMSGDPEQEYFADGMVEEIITALSRFKSLFVIARNSSFTYKGKVVDVRTVGRELGVRYVLEGSVRKAANRLRITGQLVESQTGAHLWADRFDGALEEIFHLQDRIAMSVVSAVAPKVDQAEIERARRKPTENLDAYDCYLRGLARFVEHTSEGDGAALRLFYNAIERDPDFAAPYGMAAHCHVFRLNDGLVEERGKVEAETRRLSERVLALDSDDARALSEAGHALAYCRDRETGAALIDRALAINPNLARGWGLRGWVSIYLGQHEAAREQFAQALRLSPLDTGIGDWQRGMAHALTFTGNYNEASEWANRALVRQSGRITSFRIAVVANALAGDVEIARKIATRLLHLEPALRTSILIDHLPHWRPEDLELFAKGLRVAGVPE